MEHLLRDKVTLVKKNGQMHEDIKANVQPNKVFISDETMPIEEGDRIQRKLPNGLIESYIVLDRGFYSGIGGIKSHYQCKVRKETVIPSIPPNKVIYNVSGENPRININSIDHSTNVANVSSDKLFDELRRVIEDNIEKNHEILNLIDEMEKNKSKKSFVNSYQKFISLMADHMSLVAPFISALTKY